MLADMCRALALPMATGFTASKCDGFGNIVTWQPFTSTELAEKIKKNLVKFAISRRQLLHYIKLTKKKLCKKTNKIRQILWFKMWWIWQHCNVATIHINRTCWNHQNKLSCLDQQKCHIGRFLTNPNIISYDNMYVSIYIFCLSGLS